MNDAQLRAAAKRHRKAEKMKRDAARSAPVRPKRVSFVPVNSLELVVDGQTFRFGPGTLTMVD